MKNTEIFIQINHSFKQQIIERDDGQRLQKSVTTQR